MTEHSSRPLTPASWRMLATRAQSRGKQGYFTAAELAEHALVDETRAREEGIGVLLEHGWIEALGPDAWRLSAAGVSAGVLR